ncbi:MAG: glycoside hydrolase family 16 protein [Clostridia bacterium]|nr:glycoside hydrolase family 16 protein [Clostridia bacterium]
MKRISLILCLIMIMSLFVACGDSSDTASGGGSNTTAEIFSTAAVKYVTAEGDSVYRIIRPEKSTDTETSVAALLFKQVKAAHGVQIKNVDDTNKGDDVYEILIGNTNRPETAKVREWFKANVTKRSDGYIICTVGKKIVIYGNCDDALQNAADYYVQNLLKTPQTAGIKYTYTPEGEFVDFAINGASIGEFSIVRPRLNSSYLTYAEIEEFVETTYKNTGYRLTINDDTVTDEADYEIIVGDCQRPNVTKIDNRDEYKVTVSGKKVFINGGSAQATTIAVSEFIKKVSATDKLTDADSFSGSYSTTISTYDTSTYYTPKFWDDFDDIEGSHVNANGLDTNKWKLTTSTSAGHSGFKAKRATDPEHVFVADGMFQIHPYMDADKMEFYGGFLETSNLMRFTYGYIEYSAKIPDGDGFWTAIWLRCGDYSGPARPEIDIAECFGNSKTFAFNMHTWPGIEAEQFGVTHTSLDGGKYPDKKKYCPDGKRFNDNFHTYGMLWTPEVVYATCDGVPYFKYNMGDKDTDAGCFGKLMKICISMAVGFESNSGDPSLLSEEIWNTTGRYYVDWVYVYQIDDGRQVMSFNDTTW